MNKTCLIYNYAQHYRIGVFKLLDVKLNIDSYFGDKMADVKKLDYNELANYKNELKNIQIFKGVYFQKGAVRLLFKKYDNYILLGEYYNISTWLILILAKFSNKKVFLWTHGWYGNESVLKRFIKKTFFKLSNGILLYGNYAKDLMIKEGFDTNNLHVIYNSLFYNKQLEIRNQLIPTNVYQSYFKNSNPVLVFIGRLTKVKQLNKLLEAVSNINNNGVSVNVVLIGDGVLKDELVNLSKKLNIDNQVWFYGACYDEVKIGELIYNADLCVSPGNVGLTAIHTMTYGTPVITHDNFAMQMPEFEAIKQGVTGDFFKYNDFNDLVNKINLWLKNNNREQVRVNCYNMIDDYFNPNFQLEVIKKILDEGDVKKAV
ncbi:glycosyltransferase [Olleya sp. Ti.3.14]|uniref:glycosyltransferase n=1 Tax=Olleya sp. Ti.3.14 TaxID=3121297 RepID=UPI00311F827C